MSYSYENEKSWLFTDEGQRCLLQTLSQAKELWETSHSERETFGDMRAYMTRTLP